MSEYGLAPRLRDGCYILFDAAVYSSAKVLAPFRGQRYHLKYVADRICLLRFPSVVQTLTLHTRRDLQHRTAYTGAASGRSCLGGVGPWSGARKRAPTCALFSSAGPCVRAFARRAVRRGQEATKPLAVDTRLTHLHKRFVIWLLTSLLQRLKGAQKNKSLTSYQRYLLLLFATVALLCCCGVRRDNPRWV